MTLGTATAELNGRVAVGFVAVGFVAVGVVAVGVVEVEAGAAAGLVDDEHPAPTVTNANTITVAARVFTVVSSRAGRAGP